MVRSHGWQRTCKSTLNVVRQVQYRVWIEVASMCTVPLKSQLPKSHLTYRQLHLSLKQRNNTREILMKRTKVFLCGCNLHVPLGSNMGGWGEILHCNDNCMHLYLYANFFNNPLVWFSFQLYVDSNSLPKYKDRNKDRKFVVLQKCFSYFKLSCSFSFNNVMASLHRNLLSPIHHWPFSVINEKLLHGVLPCRGN